MIYKVNNSVKFFLLRGGGEMSYSNKNGTVTIKMISFNSRCLWITVKNYRIIEMSFYFIKFGAMIRL